ncbi:hypothetical protein CRUP_015387, partial [Coryphaenoides rupestris]
MDAAHTRDDETHKDATNESNSAAESGHESHRGVVIHFIHAEVGGDLTSLANVGELLEKVRAEKETLEEQVLSASSASPLRVSTALAAAEEASRTTQRLLKREMVLAKSVDQHLQEARPWVDKLCHTVDYVDTMERHVKYLQCLQHVEELSDRIQQCLMTNSVWEAIDSVSSMAGLDAGLQESGCRHMKGFLRATLRFWHKIIKDRLA